MSKAENAEKFFQELSNAYDRLSVIADGYGLLTLTDLFCLQNAILTDGFIDHIDGSHAVEIASSLPSGHLWTKYIRLD